MKPTWILVADRSQAQVFEAGHFRVEPLRTVEVFSHPEGAMKVQDLETDRPSRFGRMGGGAGTGDPKVDLKHRTAEQFATEIFSMLEKARAQGSFGRLVIVAAPMLMGVLRDKMPAPLAQIVIAEIGKEYTGLRPEELSDRLPDEVWDHRSRFVG